MQQVFVKFNNAEQVRSFVNMIGTLDANFDMGSGRRMVDAKSLLGIFALDLTQPQKLSCNSDDASVMEKITPYLYTERLV
ncbi:MAG: HPr family phosphocarrier protein [Eubacterium sp.]|nr:HPr family phosphocarrier protein [Eubacterium sp.]